MREPGLGLDWVESGRGRRRRRAEEWGLGLGKGRGKRRADDADALIIIVLVVGMDWCGGKGIMALDLVDVDPRAQGDTLG